MEVDQDDGRRTPRLGDEVVDDLERARGHVEEERAHQVDHGDRRAVGGGRDRQRAPRGVAGEVRGPDHPLGRGEVRRDLRPPPRVVPERDDVGAGGEEPVGELGGDPDRVGDVLAVHDAQVGADLLAERRQPRLDRAAAGDAEHVGYEEDPHGPRLRVRSSTARVLREA